MKLSSLLYFAGFGLRTILLRRSDPIVGTVILTDKCNLHCKHCIADAVTTKTLIADRDEIYAIADKIIGVKPRLITVTGGEPMVLPFFFELSEYLRKNTNGEMNLMTNGTYINEENAVKIRTFWF